MHKQRPVSNFEVLGNEIIQSISEAALVEKETGKKLVAIEYFAKQQLVKTIYSKKTETGISEKSYNTIKKIADKVKEMNPAVVTALVVRSARDVVELIISSEDTVITTTFKESAGYDMYETLCEVTVIDLKTKRIKGRVYNKVEYFLASDFLRDVLTFRSIKGEALTTLDIAVNHDLRVAVNFKGQLPIEGSDVKEIQLYKESHLIPLRRAFRAGGVTSKFEMELYPLAISYIHMLPPSIQTLILTVGVDEIHVQAHTHGGRNNLQLVLRERRLREQDESVGMAEFHINEGYSKGQWFSHETDIRERLREELLKLT